MLIPRAGTMSVIVTLALLASPALAEDHSEYVEGPFESGPEVTETCLFCHDDAEEVMQSTHWTWAQPRDGDGGELHGKINAFNNFCIAVSSNWPRCTSCHAGYGWEDASFDFDDPNNVDCLVCHDRSGTYRKDPAGAGAPADDVDLTVAAQSVGGPPTKKACGNCHFYGGGGDHVKHGDLDSSLLDASYEFDVHMSADAMDFSCQDCHTTEDHQIAGNALAVSPDHGNAISCLDCHGSEPHEGRLLNQHQRVACQTCHIPAFAKGRPTKVHWDWSEAGQDLPEQTDEYGLPTYSKKKGRFVWDKNVEPTYAWYDGTASVYALGETFDPAEPLVLAAPNGSVDDPDAKIHPFKVHTGRQIYDRERNVLIVPKLYGDGGYWEDFDWAKAAELGMASVDQPFSGDYGFADTKMYWRLNHMIVPGELALQCRDCHARGESLDWQALGYEGDPIRTRRSENIVDPDESR